MNEIGQIERATQNRVVKLFQKQLGYIIWEIGMNGKATAFLKKVTFTSALAGVHHQTEAHQRRSVFPAKKRGGWFCTITITNRNPSLWNNQQSW